MLKKVQAFWKLLRTGEEVADPARWKARQIRTGALVAFLSAILGVCHALGLDIPLTDVQLESLALGILTIYGVAEVVLTAISSKRAGLLPAERVRGDVQDSPGSDR